MLRPLTLHMLDWLQRLTMLLHHLHTRQNPPEHSEASLHERHLTCLPLPPTHVTEHQHIGPIGQHKQTQIARLWGARMAVTPKTRALMMVKSLARATIDYHHLPTTETTLTASLRVQSSTTRYGPYRT